MPEMVNTERYVLIVIQLIHSRHNDVGNKNALWLQVQKVDDLGLLLPALLVLQDDTCHP